MACRSAPKSNLVHLSGSNYGPEASFGLIIWVIHIRFPGYDPQSILLPDTYFLLAVQGAEVKYIAQVLNLVLEIEIRFCL